MSGEAITFCVDGKPVPKQRPRFTGKYTYTPKRTRDYEKHVRWSGTQALLEYQRHHDAWNTGARYRVRLWFYCGDKRKRDLDNLAKSVLDALNGLLWDDDAQIDEMHVTRMPGVSTCAEVEVAQL